MKLYVFSGQQLSPGVVKSQNILERLEELDNQVLVWLDDGGRKCHNKEKRLRHDLSI